MISYNKQFRDCRKSGLNKVKSIPITPDLLPFDKKLAAKMKEKGEIELFECLLFGGICSSKNEGCLKMRHKNV